VPYGTDIAFVARSSAISSATSKRLVEPQRRVASGTVGTADPECESKALTMSSIFELCQNQATGIFAIPLRKGRREKPVRVPDGSIVESLLPELAKELLPKAAASFEIAAGGVPATESHVCLGLVIGYLPLAGVYCLPSGDIAAIYGAEVIPLDTPTRAKA
jgi:hypothetical protein